MLLFSKKITRKRCNPHKNRLDLQLTLLVNSIAMFAWAECSIFIHIKRALHLQSNRSPPRTNIIHQVQPGKRLNLLKPNNTARARTSSSNNVLTEEAATMCWLHCTITQGNALLNDGWRREKRRWQIVCLKRDLYKRDYPLIMSL